MKKIVMSGLFAGFALLIVSVLGLYLMVWLFPGLASEYYDPAFEVQSSKQSVYYLHPFVISFALSWFWSRFKTVLTGSFLTRGIEFGLIYTVVAIFPMMWLTYSAINISLPMAASWLLFGLVEGIIAGLIFEKINP